MFKNYLKIAARSFINQKYYSLLNTLGLAMGIAACILILLFVQDELSYEQPFENKGHIYRLVQDFPMGNHLSQSATVPFPTKNAMQNYFSEITNAALIYRPSSWGNSVVIKNEDEQYYEDGFVYAEHSFLEIYDFSFIHGSSEKALKEPDQVILTISSAIKYFGDENPMGKTLSLNNFRDLKVVGVIEDLPSNTHLQMDLIASFETFRSFFNDPSLFDTQWVWVAAWMYFVVEDEQAVEEMRTALPEFVKNHYPEILADKGVVLHIQNADDVHLTSSLELEFKPNGNIQHVYLFSSIAVLILFIAIFNFMNLATSRSSKRSKEVGLRKAMGASRGMLISQFIGEAVLTSFLSLFVAMLIINLTLPWFNMLTGKQISFELFNNPILLVGMVVLGGLVGILSGSYPGFILSAYKPAEVLKGKASISLSSQFLRRALVVSQFVVSISLLISIGIVQKQLNYIQTKDLGFNEDQIMLVDVNFNFFNRYSTFRTELFNNSNVSSATMLGASIPGDESVIENGFVIEGAPEEEQHWFSVIFAGYDFEKVLGVEFLQGHAFQPGNSVDSSGYILNEAAVKALGWENDVVGRKLERIADNHRTGEVIGVVKDFHYRPLYDPIKPLVIARGGGTLAIKMSTNNIAATIGEIEKEWKSQFEGTPFRYSFMDENFDTLYRKENKFSRTIQYFSVLAIIIACLGLLGLSSFATESRQKEIGIRKVNGAGTLSLLGLLTKDFSKLVLIAFFISIPVAYYFGELWLNNFAYRITMDPSIFLIAGAVAMLIAILTVSYHTVKAAISNPVRSLRYE